MPTDDLKRWEPMRSADGFSPAMEIREGGMWVYYADYAALQDEADDLQGEVDDYATLQAKLDEATKATIPTAELDAVRDALFGAIQNKDIVITINNEQGHKVWSSTLTRLMGE